MILFPNPMKNFYILQIETATPVCSVAISSNGKTLVAIEAEEQNIHASHLTLFIEKALLDAQITWTDLSAVAVSKGPGSYTGLRIGVSTAKGLCYGLDVPLIAINTLEAMAHGLKQSGRIDEECKTVLLPMIDARRMEVYTATYSMELQTLDQTAAKIIDETSFSKLDHKMCTLFGSGADKFVELFATDEKVEILTDFKNSAAFMSALAFEAFQKESFEDLVYFEPYYLKDFIATTPKKR